ncbi:coiled-coil domain-containing protein 124-like [Coffea eugenioides]|uniref:coiled-coil domain-containing protein 124-like n=1 Tax=Coffea eugenioides TaxID=49369 RepID=UPI000F60B510|nr:coiled-coil domain-containing protein 124-like [Coffea eugenioides]
MSKKKSANAKAEAAKARKSAAEANKEKLKALEKEDQEWREAEGSKSRAAQKREAAAQKQVEAAARKAETRRLAQLEDNSLENSLKKPAQKKVTQSELRLKKEEQFATVQRKAEEEKLKRSRVTVKNEYEKMILVLNTNREHDDSVLEASTVDDAIAQLTTLKEDNLPVVIKNKQHLERKSKVCAEQGKKRNSILGLGIDDEERSLLKGVRRINLDRSSLDYYEDYSTEDGQEFEEEEDFYEDDEYQEYEEKYYNKY